MQGGPTTAVEPILRLTGVAVVAGSRVLLTGLDLTLGAGELVAITGPSGSGKTSLLATINGLRPGQGAVTLRGQQPAAIGWPIYRRQVALTPQTPVLIDGTVRDNLNRPFTFGCAQAEFDAARARTRLDDLGLSEVDLDADARTLSVGQQQRICLVRALLLEPAVLLLDEPTSALDRSSAWKVEDMVSLEVSRRGAAALIVTHDPDQAARWCQRTVDLEPYLIGAADPAGSGGS